MSGDMTRFTWFRSSDNWVYITDELSDFHQCYRPQQTFRRKEWFIHPEDQGIEPPPGWKAVLFGYSKPPEQDRRAL